MNDNTTLAVILGLLGITALAYSQSKKEGFVNSQFTTKVVSSGPDLLTKLTPRFDPNQRISTVHKGEIGSGAIQNRVGAVEKFTPDAGSTGGAVDPVIYDRTIYANQRSRLQGEGDWIRGDLPILPDTTGNFRPSVRPNIDLRAGSVSQIAGTRNRTQQATVALQQATSGVSVRRNGELIYN